MVGATENELDLVRREYHESMVNRIRRNQKPYCGCSWHKDMKKRTVPMTWYAIDDCSCGEEDDLREWKWQKPPESESSWVILSENNLVAMFHPTYSSGTAAVKGDTPLQGNYHYYWEIKMLTDTYGTDIMVGLGSDKFDHNKSRHKFCSLLGKDKESYGISYTGRVQHNKKTSQDTNGFCKGTIVGLRLDMWQGTLEFYINRKSECVSFFNLRRHSALYPVVCSTAAQSCVKLVYAASWRASLLVDALKILASSSSQHARTMLPPGLWNRLKPQFWLTMPSKDGLSYEDDVVLETRPPPPPIRHLPGDFSPYRIIHRYYVDNVEPNCRMVLWEGPTHD